MHKETFAQNKASMRPGAKGERPTLSHDHRTHGRIKTEKKRFYALWFSSEIKQVFVTDRNALGKKKSLFFKGFRAQKRAILKVDDKYIIHVKNRILTGNKTAGALKKSLQHFIALKRERILK